MKDENLKVRTPMLGEAVRLLACIKDRELSNPSELRSCCNLTFFRPLVLL